jgi:hypothetical protein
MTGNIIVLTGSGRLDLQPLHRVVREFGWTIETRRGLDDIAAARPAADTAAVFFDREAVDGGHAWPDAVRRLRCVMPEARLVALHGFAEAFDWPELCDAGVFHSLWLPLKEDEVRKTLGFIWVAHERPARSIANSDNYISRESRAELERIKSSPQFRMRAALMAL